ncbi:hypothetical protein BpHYR1_050868 [Brachionus plicatilis]|uniref:RRM domain-containing protein n=1 Tax=Brachionus plicatilis TaxID=10195 RepID=A0A3M7PU12_BRAPC|nr:hypothetical protein BpHYR1_050868 [Brachionus plicatilis]
MASLLVKNLSKQTSIQILQGCFFPYKPFDVVELSESSQDSKMARIKFESWEKAAKAMDQMNKKEILNRKIEIELEQEEQVLTKDDEKKELIAEAVYPIALGRYGHIAPKLTGMLVESIIKNTKHDEEIISGLLSDDIILDELIDYAYDKYVLES